MMKKLMYVLRNYLITGILIFVPSFLTIYLCWQVVSYLDGSISDLLNLRAPVPGLGLIIFVSFSVLLGFLASTLLRDAIRRRITEKWNAFIDRLPFAGTVYKTLNLLAKGVFSSTTGKRNMRPVILEFPHDNMYSLGFLMQEKSNNISDFMQEQEKDGKKFVTVYVATAPNPTTGFVLFIDESRVHEANIGNDEALQIILSAGAVHGAPKKPVAPHSTPPTKRQ